MARKSNRDRIMEQVKGHFEHFGTDLKWTGTFVVHPTTEMFMRMMKDDAGKDYLWWPDTREEPIAGRPGQHWVVPAPTFCGVRIITDKDVAEWKVYVRQRLAVRWS
jgi:hypothetical protein